MSFGWLGKKYDDLLRKSAKVEGVEKWEQKGNFHYSLVEKILYLEMGRGGKNIILRANIHPSIHRRGRLE